MSSTIDSPSTPDHIDALLDQLMPPPGPAWRRFAVGTALTTVVVVVGLSWMFGYLVPRPTANGSYSGGGQLIHEPERNAIAVSVHLPNWSKRDVRITAVSLTTPGVRLVDAGARPQPTGSDSSAGTIEECEILSDGSEQCTGTADPLPDGYFDPWPDTVSSLPVTIAAGESVDLFLAFEPVVCDGPVQLPWGQVDVTLDFGAGAMPPWSTTIRVENPLIAGSGQAQLLEADRTVVYSASLEPGGEDGNLDGTADSVDVDGLLAAMCELTGAS